RLFQDLSFLLQVMNPRAAMDEADFWDAVLLALHTRFVQIDKSEISLGIIWNRLQIILFRYLAESYGLPPGALRTEIEFFQASRFYDLKPEIYTDADKEELRNWLRNRSPRRWKLLQGTLRISFPENVIAADVDQTGPDFSTSDALEPVDYGRLKEA